MRLAALIVITAALAACSKSGQEAKKSDAPAPQADAMSPSTTTNDTATTAPAEEPAASGEERFYGKKSFTIVYKQTGTEVGDITEHVRDWGRKRVEIKKTTMAIAGTSHSTATRTVFEGAKMVGTDLNTGAVTVMSNPMYDAVVGRMQGKSGVEIGKEMMVAMGGKPSGENGTFAGTSCDYWELAQLGTRMCITSWGATLSHSAKLGPVSIEKVAIDVREGDGGPEEAFVYDAAKAAMAPDLNEMMKRAKGH